MDPALVAGSAATPSTAERGWIVSGHSGTDAPATQVPKNTFLTAVVDWLQTVALTLVETPLMAENTSPKPPSLKQLQKREQVLAGRKAL